jgi:crotonobetainyl-CoA:carnitine CoA-transferase CaiB-like acyl-CoA transferase
LRLTRERSSSYSAGVQDLAASRPLEGVRVLDFTQNLPGPYATLVLASLGAEVIKVEPPRGDAARMFGRLFEIVNAGKRSMVLDLKDPAARPTVQALLESADVVVEGFRPGVMQRLGCDAEAALELNPGIIYCSISGYGQTGPYRDHPGHDLNYQALTGLCDMHTDASGRPHGSALPIADLSSAMTAVTSILAGLIGRQRDGRGRHIDVAIVDAAMSWVNVWSEGLLPSDARLSSMLEPLRRSLAAGGGKRLPTPIRTLLEKSVNLLSQTSTRDRVDAVGERLGQTAPIRRLKRRGLHALPHYELFMTRDERWISVGILDENKFWGALCEGVGLPLLARLPFGARLAASSPIRAMLAGAFRRRSLEEWLEVLDRSEIPVTPVLTVAQALEDAHLAARRPPDGALHAPFPLARDLGPAPELGADTQGILDEL